jgi:hypothetical protein
MVNATAPSDLTLTQILKNGAVGSRTAGTRRVARLHKRFQTLRQTFELANARTDVGQVRDRDIAELQARPGTVASECDERADLLDRKTELAAAANEGEPLDVGLGVEAVPTFLPTRLR